MSLTINSLQGAAASGCNCQDDGEGNFVVKEVGKGGSVPGVYTRVDSWRETSQAASVPRLLRPSLAGGASQIVCLKPDVHLK